MFFGDRIIKEHPLVSVVHEKGINNETEQEPLIPSVLFSVLGGWFTRQGVGRRWGVRGSWRVGFVYQNLALCLSASPSLWAMSPGALASLEGLEGLIWACQALGSPEAHRSNLELNVCSCNIRWFEGIAWLWLNMVYFLTHCSVQVFKQFSLISKVDILLLIKDAEEPRKKQSF